MIRCGLLPPAPTDSDVARWEGRPSLSLATGELTVLRTDSREPAPQEPSPPRDWIGFDVAMSDAELEAASLRLWRCKPIRVMNNELFVVTIAEFPVALYLLGAHVGSYRVGDEEFDRHHFVGDLLARLDSDLKVDTRPSPAMSESDIRTIMGSRIRTSSGGPIGYLEAD
jgi:hypothetical protein